LVPTVVGCPLTGTSSVRPSIKRSFLDLSDADVGDSDRTYTLAKLGWPKSFGWAELLRSQRILIVSEAGAGKTYECQAQQAKLWDAGEAAFFLDLATLAVSSVRDMLGGEGEEERLDGWLRSQSERAGPRSQAKASAQLGCRAGASVKGEAPSG
jgi:hypothetical protein